VESTPPGQTWFLEVKKEGGCWIGPKILARLGIDVHSDSPPALALFLGDEEVPLLSLKTAAGWGAFFFAPHHPTRYSTRTAFRLEVGKEGTRMTCEAEETSLEPSKAATSAVSFIHLEEDKRYFPQAQLETPWLWAPLYAPATLTLTVGLTDAVPGPITVTLQLWSYTDFPVSPDHRLRLRWDDKVVGDWKWDGIGVQVFRSQFNEDNPQARHSLALETPLLPGVEASVVWLDYVELAYRRTLGYFGGIWLAEGNAFQIGESGVYIIDITEPLRPERCVISAGGAIATVPGHRYWVGKPQRALPPVEVRPARSLKVEELSDVEYLAVAPVAFHRALSPLLELRREQGLRVGVVEPAAVYDAFGDGRPDPAAIYNLIGNLPSLRYLLLVGDGASEPWGYEGEAGRLRVVVPFTRTAVLGETPADVLFGLSPSGEPAVAVGRLPAASPWELTTMVNKISRWEDSKPLIVMVSDNEEDFRSVTKNTRHLCEELGFEVKQAQERSKILVLLKGDHTWLNYFGHASLVQFGEEGLLVREDGSEWAEPVLVTVWGCLAANFVHPAQDSIAEAWLRSRGGAVAFLGPVGETTLSEQRPFAMAFYRALGSEKRIGDAWLQALKTAKLSDVSLGYTLLGDPALIVSGEDR